MEMSLRDRYEIAMMDLCNSLSDHLNDSKDSAGVLYNLGVIYAIHDQLSPVPSDNIQVVVTYVIGVPSTLTFSKSALVEESVFLAAYTETTAQINEC